MERGASGRELQQQQQPPESNRNRVKCSEVKPSELARERATSITRVRASGICYGPSFFSSFRALARSLPFPCFYLSLSYSVLFGFFARARASALGSFAKRKLAAFARGPSGTANLGERVYARVSVQRPDRKRKKLPLRGARASVEPLTLFFGASLFRRQRLIGSKAGTGNEQMLSMYCKKQVKESKLANRNSLQVVAQVRLFGMKLRKINEFNISFHLHNYHAWLTKLLFNAAVSNYYTSHVYHQR